VELVFDNSDGKLGGEYASFAEVSLKRVVSRDGTSSYFLNGVRCRRKDITQLFLGTGLGSRSYAIIEQNMISRVIEARPTTCGHSSRRRRASRATRSAARRRRAASPTRARTSRASDLRDEVEKQLRHLQRQAATARRYQSLKQEERQSHAELLALRLREVESESGARQAILGERDLALQAAWPSSVPSRRDRAARQEHDEGSAVSPKCRVATTRSARRSRAPSRPSTTPVRCAPASDRSSSSSRRACRTPSAAPAARRQLAAELAAALADLGPGLEAARAAEEAAASGLAAAESAMHDWQERWEAVQPVAAIRVFRGRRPSARASRSHGQPAAAPDGAARPRHAGARCTRGADVAATLAELEQQEPRRARVSRTRGRPWHAEPVPRCRPSAPRARAGRGCAVGASRNAGCRRPHRLARGAAAGGARAGPGQGRRLAQVRGLEAQPASRQQLTVDKGWERAVETVLGRYLEAVCVDSIDDVAGHARQPDERHGDLLAGAQGPAGLADTGRHAARARARPGRPRRAVRGHRRHRTLGEALHLRPRLRAGQSVITRDGIWIGPDWLRVSRDKDAHEGVIEREQNAAPSAPTLEQQQARHRAAEASSSRLRGRVRELEDRLADSRRRCRAGFRTHEPALAGRQPARPGRAAQQRMQQLASSSPESSALEVAERRQPRLPRRLEEAVNAMAELEERRVPWRRSGTSCASQLARPGSVPRQHRNAAREVAIRVESHRTSHAVAARGHPAPRRTDRRSSNTARGSRHPARLRRDRRVRAQGHAREALQRRLAVEAELSEARRKAWRAVDAGLRELDERRATAESAVEEARSALENVRFSVQELKPASRDAARAVRADAPRTAGRHRPRWSRRQRGRSGSSAWRSNRRRSSASARSTSRRSTSSPSSPSARNTSTASSPT
jgi:chromosome segregation protein